nr:tumor suppressor candidate 2 isoform X1 [Manis javanica]
MGASGSKARGLWPFASAAGGGGPEAAGVEQALVRPRSRVVPPFVFTRRGSMFYDEDGDLAHEFYEETIVTKNGQKRAKLRRVHKNLIPQVSGGPHLQEDPALSQSPACPHPSHDQQVAVRTPRPCQRVAVCLCSVGKGPGIRRPWDASREWAPPPDLR